VTWAYVLLHGLALVLALALVVGLPGGSRRSRLLRGALMLVLAASTASVAFFGDPLSLPGNGEVVVLHEGGTEQGLAQLHGLGVHAGEAFRDLRRVLGDPPDLRRIVWMNQVLGALAAVLATLGLYLASGSFLVALVVGRIHAQGMVGFHTASSELPAALLGIQLWLGVLGAREVAAALDARAAGLPAAGRRWVWGALLLALVTGLAAATRAEVAGLGLAGLLVAGLRRWAGDARLAAVDRIPGAALDALRTRWRFLVLAAAVLVLCLAARRVTRDLEPVVLRWVLTGWNPAELLGVLQLPVLLGRVWPVGVVILMVLGLVHGLRRWRETLGLGLAVPALWAIYHQASHGTWLEAFRYLLYLAPALLLLAGLGWRELRGVATRRGWPRGWERVALAVLALLLLVPHAAGRAALFGMDRATLTSDRARALDLDVQREVRTLLDWRDLHPGCTLVAPVCAAAAGEGRCRSHRWVMTEPSGDGPEPLPPDADPATGEGIPGDCVLLYLGLDCALAGGTSCDGYAAGLPRVEERVFPAAPYNDAQEYGATEPLVRLRLHRVRGLTAPIVPVAPLAPPQ